MKKTFKVILLDDNQRGNCIGLIQCIKDRKAMFSEDDCKAGQLGIGVNISEGVKEYWKPVNLFIISDDRPKDGDYYMYKNESVHSASKELNPSAMTASYNKKIVATTDNSLFLPEINFKEWDGSNRQLPQLPESFIQAYIKAYNEGNPITEVDLEMIECKQPESCNNSLSKKCICPKGLKTRPDNTVIVHQSKMYSREDVIKLIQAKIDEYAVDAEGDIEYNALFGFQDWIEDNL